MSDRRCETCAYYAPGQQWCMEWGRNVSPEQSCGRWYPEHGKEASPVVTAPKRIRIAPRHSYAAMARIHRRLYVSVRALRQIGMPASVVIDVEPDTKTLIVSPGDGQPDAWRVYAKSGSIGTRALAEDLARHGFPSGRYMGEVVGQEIRIRGGSRR